jgi:hypothetical protein
VAVRRWVRTLVCVTVVAALVPVGVTAQETTDPEGIAADGRDDVTVIAVVDGSFQPQHWNWASALMPQHLDDDPSNDLPLTQAPDTWMPGFDTSGMAGYHSLPLAIDLEDGNRTVASLQQESAASWSEMQRSSRDEVHYYWVPDSKVVGMVHFGTGQFRGGNTAHGAGTSSVAAGNLHGTCPECVVVLITYAGSGDREAASDWAMSQPWIDVVTNSFGFSQVERERLYSGSNTDLQREASERGQTIFFSSGNGISNTFSVPNTTLFSSQEGPDWIVTVGAVAPSGGEFSGAGKPADIASVGSGYPSQYGGTTVSSGGNFGGTSNSTPVTAGIYAHSLYWARRQLDGPRQQAGGVLATGTPVACGEANADCELGDGVLTASELRTRLFHGAIHTPEGINPANTVSTPVKTAETEFASEGHGTYFGKLRGEDAYAEEISRITGPMGGTAAVIERSADERDWMIVDSWCRQQIWGGWSGGYYLEGETALPGDDPAFPIRTALTNSCGEFFPPVE